MQPRLVAFALMAVSSVVLAAIASACGDGEYFEGVKAILDEETERFAAPQFGDDVTTVRDPEAPVQDRIEAFRNILEESAAFRDTAQNLDDLDPPAQAEEAHNELVDSKSDLADIVNDLSDRAVDLDSQSELEDLLAELDGPEFIAVEDRAVQACFALQTIADDNNIDVDLHCAGE